ncbi:uncharacterized protein PFLUO_LOCUS8318 [Penicillium psychrofluorescens]|uniref:uncharacterized protein n=1 Tax=Penicillium psychrofluorescens TaxID=3158075 RepID=UPI003CCE02BF
MGTGERAVSHAAVALSAIYQDIEVSGAPLPGQDLSSNWHYFAMDQAGRSLANLNSRSVSHDPHKQEVVLVCCLLFLLMELLRGRYDEAFHHLRAGLRIVDELKAQRQLVTSPAHESPIEDCLVAAFAQLDIQSAYYGVGGPVLRIEEELPSSSHSDLDLSNPFMSVQEARRAIEPLASRAFPFVSSSWSLPDQEIASDYRRLLMQQQEILSELAQFIENFKDLSTRRYGLLDRKSQKAADIMDILWNTMSVSVRTCLVRDPVALDKFKPEYEISLALVEELFLKYPERPAFTLDMGVLPALFTIAFQCPSYSLRRRSIELLRSWPHREGIYDSQWAVFVAIERMRYELEMQRIREDNMRDLEVSSRSAYPGTDISTELIVDWIQDEKALIVKEMLESSPKCQDYSLEMAMETTKCLRGWSCVQALQTFKSCCTLQNS